MSTMEKQNKRDNRNFKTCSFGEKAGTKELKVSAKPCAEKSIINASSMIATPLCCIGTPGEVPWRQGSTRSEPQFLKEESMRGFLLQKSKI